MQILVKEYPIKIERFSKIYYAYLCDYPCDWNHTLLLTVDETIKKIENTEEKEGVPDRERFENAFILGQKIAKEKLSWEGDFRKGEDGGPYVFWIPCPQRCDYGFLWKQENNGNTFVISPVPLPDLIGDDINKMVEFKSEWTEERPDYFKPHVGERLVSVVDLFSNRSGK